MFVPIVVKAKEGNIEIGVTDKGVTMEDVDLELLTILSPDETDELIKALTVARKEFL